MALQGKPTHHANAVIDPMERILDSLARLHFRLFGKKELSRLERHIISAWRESLGEREREILDTQVSTAHIIQRQAGGARLVFYWLDSGDSIRLFPNQEPDLHAADIFIGEVGAPLERTMRVKLYMNRGRLASVEYPKRPDRYFELHKMPADKLVVLGVQQTASVS